MTTATLGISVSSNADKAAVDLDKLTASAARAEAGTDRLAASSMRATQHMSINSANIAAQMQDVVVSAQMGMNGIQVGLQQGTQLAAVLNHVRTSGMGVGAALATSFMSIINPLSLVTIGLIAVGTYAIQALGGITSGAATASEAIEDHAEKVGAIVKGYKDAEGAVREWADEMQRSPREVVESNLGKSLEDANRELERFQRKTANVALTMPIYIGEQASAAAEAVRSLLVQFSEGQISARTLQVELTNIGNGDLGLLSFQLKDMINDLANGAQKAAALQSSLVLASHALAETYGATSGGPATKIGLDSYVDSQRSAASHQIELDALRAKTPAQQRDIAMRRERLKLVDEEISESLREQKVNEAGELAYARAQAAAGRSGAKSYDAFGNSLRTAQERLATQQMEIEMFGQSTAALETMRVSQELTNQAKQNGIDLNSVLAGSEITVAEAIEQTAEKSGAAAQEMERLQYQQAQIDALNNTLASGFANLFIGIADGSKSAQESIGDLLSSLGKLLINQAFQNLFAPTAVGGGGFNPFGFLMGPGRAGGGPVTPGRIYPVNENTANTEYFAPAVSGTILTADQVRGGVNDNAAPVFHISIDARGAERGAGPEIAREVRKALPNAMREYERNPMRRIG